VDPRAGLDTVVKRENTIIATAQSLTPIIQPVASQSKTEAKRVL